MALTRSIKTLLEQSRDRLEQGGFSLAARILNLPFALSRSLQEKEDRRHREQHRQALKAAGKWHPFLKPPWSEEEQEMENTLASLSTQEGKEAIHSLEAKMQEGLQAPESAVIATSSGRTALQLILRVLRERHPERTTVILPAFCCAAVLHPVLEVGLTPLLGDIGPDLTLSADSVEKWLSEKTLAVLPAHMGGQKCGDLDAIRQLTGNQGAFLIEDVCPALGGKTAGKLWGGDSDFAIFSFGLGKTLTASAGGMLAARVYPDAIRREAEKLAEEPPEAFRKRFLWIRDVYFRHPSFLDLPWCPRPDSAFHGAFGFRKMAGGDAVLLNRQWERLEEIVGKQIRNAELLAAYLGDCPGIKFPGKAPHVWTKFPILCQSKAHREALVAKLRVRGVEGEPAVPLLQDLPEGRGLSHEGLEGGESIRGRLFHLPARPQFSETDVCYLAESLKAAIDEWEREQSS